MIDLGIPKPYPRHVTDCVCMNRWGYTDYERLKKRLAGRDYYNKISHRHG